MTVPAAAPITLPCFTVLRWSASLFCWGVIVVRFVVEHPTKQINVQMMTRNLSELPKCDVADPSPNSFRAVGFISKTHTNPLMGGSIEKVNHLEIFPILGRVDAKLVNKRLRELRLSLGLSQEAIGAQGFVSTPGWVKIENGTRQPSDALLEKLVVWLEKDRYLTKKEGDRMLEELLSLKYMNHLSPFIRRLARDYYETIGALDLLRAAEEPAIPRKKS